MDNAIWDNTNPCDVSLEDMGGTEDLANIYVTKESIATTTTLMPSVYNQIWYNTHEEWDSWHNVLETMNGY